MNGLSVLTVIFEVYILIREVCYNEHRELAKRVGVVTDSSLKSKQIYIL